MKAKQIITLIVGITSVAFSPIAWAAGHGGGGGGGGFGGGGGHSGGGGFDAQHVGGGAGSRGGGVGFGTPRFGGGAFRAAPYSYGGTHFAGRSLGGSNGAFRYYNGGTRTSAARANQF